MNRLPGFTAKQSLSKLSVLSRKLVTVKFSATNKYLRPTVGMATDNYPRTVATQSRRGLVDRMDYWKGNCIPGCVCVTGENCPCCGYGELLGVGPRKPVW
jgi:hypothetical protein